jgi:RNA polymerase sigma-70 factor, ECF subfamily
VIADDRQFRAPAKTEIQLSIANPREKSRREQIGEGNPRRGASARYAMTGEDREQLRRGEPKAFQTFFKLHVGLVYGIAYQNLRDRMAAEDLTQEVFAKAHRAIGRYDPRRDPAPWIATITYNECRNLWRSKENRIFSHSVPLDEASDRPSSSSSREANPEGALIARERIELVRKAIGRLPRPLQSSIMLYDYAGLGHREAARLSGLSYGAARKRYSRAVAALALKLDPALAVE